MQLHCHSFLLFVIKLMELFYKNGNSPILLYYLTPPTQIGYKSCCGNFFAVDVERVEGIGGLGVAAIPNPWVVIK